MVDKQQHVVDQGGSLAVAGERGHANGPNPAAAMGNQGPATKAEQQPPCFHGQKSDASRGESGTDCLYYRGFGEVLEDKV